MPDCNALYAEMYEILMYAEMYDIFWSLVVMLIFAEMDEIPDKETPGLVYEIQEKETPGILSRHTVKHTVFTYI